MLRHQINPIVGMRPVPESSRPTILVYRRRLSHQRELRLTVERRFPDSHSLFKGKPVISFWGKSIKRLLADEDGPTAVEYAVLLALIVAACVGAVQTMSQATRNSFDTSTNAISNAIGS